MATHHDLPDTPGMMVLGYLDAATPPVLRAASGGVHMLPAESHL